MADLVVLDSILEFGEQLDLSAVGVGVGREDAVFLVGRVHQRLERFAPGGVGLQQGVGLLGPFVVVEVGSREFDGLAGILHGDVQVYQPGAFEEGVLKKHLMDELTQSVQLPF